MKYVTFERKKSPKIIFPNPFWECFGETFLGKCFCTDFAVDLPFSVEKGCFMRKQNFKGRCEKRTVGKCEDVCKTFDPIQYAYANVLQASSKVKSFCCNVPLDEEDIVPKDDIVPQNDISVAEYTSDFVCTKTTGEKFVRECVDRKFLTKPLTLKLLDASRSYWLRHGIVDWGIVINEE